MLKPKRANRVVACLVCWTCHGRMGPNHFALKDGAVCSLCGIKNPLGNLRKMSIQEVTRVLGDPGVMVALQDKLDSRKRRWVRQKLLRLEEISLEQRIWGLLEDLPIPTTREAIRGFARRCANYRNELSHFGGPRNHPPAEGYYEKLNAVTEAAQLLFGVIVLRGSGVSQELIQKAVTETPHAKIRLLRMLRNVGLEEGAC